MGFWFVSAALASIGFVFFDFEFIVDGRFRRITLQCSIHERTLVDLALAQVEFLFALKAKMKPEGASRLKSLPRKYALKYASNVVIKDHIKANSDQDACSANSGQASLTTNTLDQRPQNKITEHR